MKKFGISWISVVVFSVASILALYYDSKPVWIGLVLSLVFVILSGLIGGKNSGALTGLLSSSIGLMIKINYYFVPEKYRSIPETLSGEKLAKLTSKIEKFHNEMTAYTATLSKYALIIVAGFIAIGFIAGIINTHRLKNKNYSRPKDSLFNVKNLTRMSVFIAIAVALNSVRVGNISFSGFPIITSGFMLDPVSGLLVGGIADVVGFLVRPSGNAFHPAFTITSALTGFLPAALLCIPFIKKYRYNFLTVLIAIAMGQLITSVIMAPLFRLWLFGHNLLLTMPKALIKQAYSVPIYTFLYLSLAKAMQGNYARLQVHKDNL